MTDDNSQRRPNVLLITTDHWPGDLLGCAGHPAIETPTLDELARSGMRFTNTYSECPVCVPARRTLMTGLSPRAHGVRDNGSMTQPMPETPTLAGTFSEAGYQTFAVGKLHVYPQRNRIGFDDALIEEDGRVQHGVLDDYELFLGDRGHAGQDFAHGMGSNHYMARPWHLPEELHVTNWAARQMARTIARRDPTRPAFWYLSFRHPHPPLVPLQPYLEMYENIEVDDPVVGEWARETQRLPYALRMRASQYPALLLAQARLARRAFYALCTHIDHQLRVVIGTLREAGVLQDTIILFTSDHGDMLGDHNLWAKQLFYERAAKVPLILLGVADDARIATGNCDHRLVGLCDVMPTLLEMAGITAPDQVEGVSMLGSQRREHLYGECGEDALASRMIRQGRFKLIYYPAGQRAQLFDLENDPRELNDLADAPQHLSTRKQLEDVLQQELYGDDRAWLNGSTLIGQAEPEFVAAPNRGLSGQRGAHWPPPLA